MAISLLEHRLPHEKTLVDLSDKPDDFVSLYASACNDPTMSAKVPILQTDDGVTLIESMVIVEYLDDLQDCTRAFTPEERARCRLWAALVPSWLSWFGLLRAESGSEEEAAAAAKLRGGLRAMDAFLSETGGEGPFLLGDTFSAAEAATAPWVLRLMKVLPAMRPTLDPARWFDEDGLTRLASWVDAVCMRPSCIDTLPPPTELQTSYSRMLERIQAAASK